MAYEDTSSKFITDVHSLLSELGRKERGAAPSARPDPKVGADGKPYVKITPADVIRSDYKVVYEPRPVTFAEPLRTLMKIPLLMFRCLQSVRRTKPPPLTRLARTCAITPRGGLRRRRRRS